MPYRYAFTAHCALARTMCENVVSCRASFVCDGCPFQKLTDARATRHMNDIRPGCNPPCPEGTWRPSSSRPVRAVAVHQSLARTPLARKLNPPPKPPLRAAPAALTTSLWLCKERAQGRTWDEATMQATGRDTCQRVMPRGNIAPYRVDHIRHLDRRGGVATNARVVFLPRPNAPCQQTYDPVYSLEALCQWIVRMAPSFFFCAVLLLMHLPTSHGHAATWEGASVPESGALTLCRMCYLLLMLVVVAVATGTPQYVGRNEI